MFLLLTSETCINKLLNVAVCTRHTALFLHLRAISLIGWNLLFVLIVCVPLVLYRFLYFLKVINVLDASSIFYPRQLTHCFGSHICCLYYLTLIMYVCKYVVVVLRVCFFVFLFCFGLGFWFVFCVCLFFSFVFCFIDFCSLLCSLLYFRIQRRDGDCCSTPARLD